MAIENFIANYSSANTRLISNNGLIIIPVVVHVLHRGEPEGQGLNVSTAKILAQIDVLNKDFRRLNDDRINTPTPFVSVAADFNIEFRLACIDPNGNPTNGIVRKYTSKESFVIVDRPDGFPDDAQTGIKTSETGDESWDTETYLNIWLCNIRFVRGYATRPGDFFTYPQYDGIVVRFSDCGPITSSSGRTATHEIGHWLNLKHLNGDSQTISCAEDDEVADTPPQDQIQSTCRVYPSTFARCNPSDPSTMFMNFMEAVPDDCMNLFTEGQKSRARAVFATQPRLSFIDNYFKIVQPVLPFGCIGFIGLSNPACLASVWSIASGPATIIAGQGTNICTLQATGTGNVLLRATSGNYISEVTVAVTSNPDLSGVIVSGQASVCNNQPSFYSVNLPYGASVSWSANPGGKVSLAPIAPAGNVMTIPINNPTGSYTLTANVTLCNSSASPAKVISFNTSPPPYTCSDVGNGSCSIQVPRCISQYNAEWGYFIPNNIPDVPKWRWTVSGGKFRDGSTSQVLDRSYSLNYVTPDYGTGSCILYIRPVSVCGVEQTGEPFKYVIINTYQPCNNYLVSPNPANSDLTIETQENSTGAKSATTKNTIGFDRIQVVDKTGFVVLDRRFPADNKKAVIGVSGLKPDLYIVRVFNKNTTEEYKIIIQH